MSNLIYNTEAGYRIYKVLGGRANSWLISRDDECILVDTGPRRAADRLKKNIEKTGMSLSSIKFLILTHTHFDHCGSAAAMHEATGCRIIAGKKEAVMAEKGYTPIPAGTSSFSRMVSRVGKLIGKLRFGYPSFNTGIAVEEQVNLENEGFPSLRVISTPGHSEGSISIVVDNAIAIAGDTVFGIFRNSIFPPFADNVPEMLNSWEKLLDTGCRLFLPGHGKSIKREKLLQEFNARKLQSFE